MPMPEGFAQRLVPDLERIALTPGLETLGPALARIRRALA